MSAVWLAQQPEATRQGWEPALEPPSPSPFLGIQCGQQSLWKLELFGGKSGHREAGAQS